MYIFKLKPTPKSVKWFEENNYDLKAMGAAVSLLFAEVENLGYTKQICLTIQVTPGSDESSYEFQSNKIWLCDNPDEYAKSLKRKQQAVFLHFLHEFRHWMQSRVHKVSHTKLDYSIEDANRNANAYFKNEYEVDARRFAKNHLSRFCKYYKAFKH